MRHLITSLATSRLLRTQSTMSSSPKDITIIGGGIIGCSTAYFLTRHPAYSPKTHRITLLEASASSAGGRTPDSITDPATLIGPGSSFVRNPAHDGIAGGASGKAGGLLALWAFPKNIASLSFRLHDELAKEHGGDKRWGYRRCYASQVECLARLPPGEGNGAVEASAAGAGGTWTGPHRDHRITAETLKRLGAPADLDWLDTEHALRGYDGVVGTSDDTAQVHPELFTRSMAQLAEDRGVKIITGAQVTAIRKTADGRGVEGVTYERTAEGGGGGTTQHELATTHCVVAAGPWTSRLLPDAHVHGERAHSVVVRTPRTVSPYALFTSIQLPPGFPQPTAAKDDAGPRRRARFVDPEIYARPDGSCYACGPTDHDVDELPASNAGVEVDEARCDDIVRQIASISDELGRDGLVIAKQACFLPQGGPWIGEYGGTKGLIIAAGHTCWGIQNAPATGKLVSEIIFDGKAKSAKLGGCDPSLA
jgi:glycine/D-amino acid oxidase-like deaminating enzyme